MGKHWAKHRNVRQARSFISGAILLRLQQRRGEASDTFRAQPCRTFLCLEQKKPHIGQEIFEIRRYRGFLHMKLVFSLVLCAQRTAPYCLCF